VEDAVLRNCSEIERCRLGIYIEVRILESRGKVTALSAITAMPQNFAMSVSLPKRPAFSIAAAHC
jgi:hypothetical protein